MPADQIIDHPDAIDNDLLVEHVRALKAGEAVELPVYDFRTHTRLAETLHMEPRPIIIVEGILIFADKRRPAGTAAKISASRSGVNSMRSLSTT